MKFIKYTFSRIQTLITIAALAVPVMCSFSELHAQPTTLAPVGVQTPNNFTSDTIATPLTLTNGQSVTFTAGGTNSLAKTIRQDHGISVFVTVISTNTLSVGTLLGWDITPDGIIFTANHPFQMFVPSNFIGTNTYWTNWPATTANNFRKIQLDQATNSILGAAGAAGSNTNTVKIIVGYSQSAAAP